MPSESAIVGKPPRASNPGTFRGPDASGDASSTPDSGRSRTFLDLFCLTAIAGFLFFVSLGARDLWNPNEPIYGRVVAEMAERGDWTVPTLNGRAFSEKPILYYWAARAAALVTGDVDEFSLRVPAALAGMASILLTYLLVLPYAGRRRAIVAALLLVSMPQVFMLSRSVQMDILVLASTLGVLVPLTRMLDFGMRPARAWMLAGIAAGLGFIGKGPVAWVLPGLVIFIFAAAEKNLRRLLSRWIVLGAVIAVMVAAPWYVALGLSGEGSVLYDVLIRQNFTRFTDAWDHQNPWWYFLTYIWTDYAPWSLLLPAAMLSRSVISSERKLDRLSWIWIASIIVFFSLSECKRSPYILPVAPAVAALAAAVVDRWAAGLLARGARIAAAVAFAFLGLALLAGGTYALLQWAEVPAILRASALPFAVFLPIAGLLVGGALAQSTATRRLVPRIVLVVMIASQLWVGIRIFPAANPLKSARAFSNAMNEELAMSGGTVVAYRIWHLRAEYSYYGQRNFTILEDPAGLLSFWRGNDRAYVLVEERQRAEVEALVPDEVLVREARIGNRKVYLFGRDRDVPRFASAGPGDSRDP